MDTQYKYLQLIKYSSLLLWDIKRYFTTQVLSSFPVVRLGDYINEESAKYSISDPNKRYGILGVNNKDGIFDAYEESGSKIKQKYKKMQVGWIAYNPYRVNVGSIGIRTNEHNYDYISPAYVVFSCKSGLLPDFLFLLLKTDLFNRIIRENTTGSVRQNLNFSILSNLQIPLPSLEEQNTIVTAYKKAISLAEQYEKQAERINDTIETYLLEELGLNTILSSHEHMNNDYKYLYFVNMKDMSDRWDIYNVRNSIFSVFEHAKYPVVSIGNTYDFVTRTWRKSGETFQYVELGDVSPLYGITNAQTLETKKAPSRATQTIQAKDLIIGTTRPYLKRFAIVTDEYTNNVCSSGFQVIAPDAKYNLQFLYEYMMTIVATKQFEYYMTGALYPAITNKDLRKIQIPLPPLDVQNEIVAHISEIKEQIKSLRALAVNTRTAAIQQFEQIIFEKI